VKGDVVSPGLVVDLSGSERGFTSQVCIRWFPIQVIFQCWDDLVSDQIVSAGIEVAIHHVAPALTLDDSAEIGQDLLENCVLVGVGSHGDDVCEC
jgi:hypothetical protein